MTRLGLARGSGLSEQDEGPNHQSPEHLRALADAMAHPVRAKLLFAVAERSEEGVSVRQLSQRLREPPRRVRYHLDGLLDLGLVAIADERTRRGVLERFYRAEKMPKLNNEQLEAQGDDQARQMCAEVLKAVLADASSAVGAKIFGLRPGHVLARLPGEVDQQGWEELGAVQEETIAELQAVISRSRERLKASGQSPIPALVALFLFEMPRWPSP